MYCNKHMSWSVHSSNGKGCFPRRLVGKEMDGMGTFLWICIECVVQYTARVCGIERCEKSNRHTLLHNAHSPIHVRVDLTDCVCERLFESVTGWKEERERERERRKSARAQHDGMIFTRFVILLLKFNSFLFLFFSFSFSFSFQDPCQTQLRCLDKSTVQVRARASCVVLFLFLFLFAAAIDPSCTNLDLTSSPLASSLSFDHTFALSLFLSSSSHTYPIIHPSSPSTHTQNGSRYPHSS